MTDFIYFLGRFHVLVLHLPLGILTLAVVMEVLARRARFAVLQPALSLVWLAGGLSALVTVALGYMHASEPGFVGPPVNHHRWAGTALALAAMAVWAWRLEAPSLYAKVWPTAPVVIVVLMFVTGHLGGNLTHGSTYLTEYAPGPFRSMGGGSTDYAEDQPRDPVTDIAEADIYLDIVSPSLRQRCSACHNEGKRRGGLSIMHYDALMQGGEDGAVIVAGSPDASDLYRRITLPHDHVNAMPKEGKTPLDEDQVAAIGWWIEKGAPATGKVGDLEPDEETLAHLRKVAGL